MLTLPSGRFVIRAVTFMCGVFAAGCNSSNPVAPSSSTSTPPPSVAIAADVSQVLPASMPPSALPQTLRVEGHNFQSGLTVDFTFTPEGTQTPAGRRLKSGDKRTFRGSEIRHLTDRSFEIDVMVTEHGRYHLCVTNPEAPPSEPVAVESEPNASARPVVTALTPASPIPGSVPQSLHVAGTNFEEGLSAELTRPNGQVVPFDSESIVFDSAVEFHITVTFDQVGSYSLRVVNFSGQASAPWVFTVGSGGAPPPLPPAGETPTPSITGMSPESPTKSGESQNVKITGGNFAAGLSVVLSGPGDLTKTIDGSKVWDVTPTSFRFSVAFADAGGYSLRVVNASGKTSAPRTFTVKAPELAGPTISAIDPGSPTANSAAKPLYVLGTHFEPGLVVKFTRPNGESTTIGESAIAFSSSTAFQVMATLPSAGTYSLRVVNPSGQMSEPWTFTVKSAEAPTPSVSGISPESLTKSSSCQVLTVTGQNFVEGLTVKVTKPGGSSMTVSGGVMHTSESAISHVTSTSFQMCVVLSEAGGYSLKVTNPSGKSSEPKTFIVTSPDGPAPTITGLSPTSLHRSDESRRLYVTGANFQSGLKVKLTRPGGYTSTISGDAITFVSSTSFQVMVTLGDAGHYTLRVMNPSEQMSEPWEFTVSGESD